MATERHRFGRQPLPAKPTPLDRKLLKTVEGKATLARIRAALCEESAVDLDEHAARVAIDALSAKAVPRTRFAAATLIPERV